MVGASGCIHQNSIPIRDRASVDVPLPHAHEDQQSGILSEMINLKKSGQKLKNFSE